MHLCRHVAQRHLRLQQPAVVGALSAEHGREARLAVRSGVRVQVLETEAGHRLGAHVALEPFQRQVVVRLRLPVARARLLEQVADVKRAAVRVDALHERPEAAECRLLAARRVLAQGDADVELHLAHARSTLHHHQVAHLSVVRGADEALQERRLETSRDFGGDERDRVLLRGGRVHDELELVVVGGAREDHRVVGVVAVAVAVDPIGVEALEPHGAGEGGEPMLLDAVLDDQVPPVDGESGAAQVTQQHVVSVHVQVERLRDLVAQTSGHVIPLLVGHAEQ